MAELVNMAEQFQGLPMSELIGGPLMAVCEAQTNLAKSTALYIKEIGLQELPVMDSSSPPQPLTVPDPSDSSKTIPVTELKTRQVDFSYKQPMESLETGTDGEPLKRDASGARSTDDAATPTGTLSQSEVSVSAPLLAILPIPALLIQDVEVEFNMEVKSSATNKSSQDASASTSASFGWGPFSASVQGSISSHKEQTRKSDNSAKYHVKVTAKQADTPEGLSKILDMLSKSITPHTVKPAETP